MLRKDQRKIGQDLSIIFGLETRQDEDNRNDRVSTVEEWARSSIAAVRPPKLLSQVELSDNESQTDENTSKAQTESRVDKLEISGISVGSPSRPSSSKFEARKEVSDGPKSKKRFQIPKISHLQSNGTTKSALDKNQIKNTRKLRFPPAATKISKPQKPHQLYHNHDLFLGELSIPTPSSPPKTRQILIDSGMLIHRPSGGEKELHPEFTLKKSTKSQHQWFGKASTGRLNIVPPHRAVEKVTPAVLLVGQRIESHTGHLNPQQSHQPLSSVKCDLDSKDDQLDAISEEHETDYDQERSFLESKDLYDVLEDYEPRPEPIRLEPAYVTDGTESELDYNTANFPYSEIDQVDDVVRKYSQIIQDRAKKLSVPIKSETDDEFPENNVRISVAASELGIEDAPKMENETKINKELKSTQELVANVTNLIQDLTSIVDLPESLADEKTVFVTEEVKIAESQPDPAETELCQESGNIAIVTETRKEISEDLFPLEALSVVSATEVLELSRLLTASPPKENRTKYYLPSRRQTHTPMHFENSASRFEKKRNEDAPASDLHSMELEDLEEPSLEESMIIASVSFLKQNRKRSRQKSSKPPPQPQKKSTLSNFVQSDTSGDELTSGDKLFGKFSLDNKTHFSSLENLVNDEMEIKPIKSKTVRIRDFKSERLCLGSDSGIKPLEVLIAEQVAEEDVKTGLKTTQSFGQQSFFVAGNAMKFTPSEQVDSSYSSPVKFHLHAKNNFRIPYSIPATPLPRTPGIEPKQNVNEFPDEAMSVDDMEKSTHKQVSTDVSPTHEKPSELKKDDLTWTFAGPESIIAPTICNTLEEENEDEDALPEINKFDTNKENPEFAEKSQSVDFEEEKKSDLRSTKHIKIILNRSNIRKTLFRKKGKSAGMISKNQTAGESAVERKDKDESASRPQSSQSTTKNKEFERPLTATSSEEVPTPVENVNPKEYYIIRRRSTSANFTFPNIQGLESLSSLSKTSQTQPTITEPTPRSNRPSVSNRPLNLSQLDTIKQSNLSITNSDSISLSTSSLGGSYASIIPTPDVPKSFGLPERNHSISGTPNNIYIEQRPLTEDGLSLYEYVHNVERRRQIFNEIELSKFATFNDPANENSMEQAEMEEEVKKLSGLLKLSTVPIPAYLRRRGYLLARLKRYDEALGDFTKSIKFDPFNTEVYWNRHQLYLLKGNIEMALKDLDAITEANRQHIGAIQAKARIYQELGAIKLAIVNYSQVIKLKPDDPDGYYQRACLFEQENEMVYANEDFKMVRLLDPTNEHAIKNLAVYSFERQLWNEAVQAFSKLIYIHPEDGMPYAYRGQAYAYLAKWEAALRDLTTAIQLDPDKGEYFFHRACLLRERNIKKSIEDFSVSLILDDSSNNIEAYYQRALLYYKLGMYDLAALDYNSVIELEPIHFSAHLNLGILQMKYFNQYQTALENFNRAITSDPTQIRSYLCRGELYQILHSETLGELNDGMIPEKRRKKGISQLTYLDRAIRDYSKAIHLSPTNYLLYLYRGRLLLKMSMMKEATYDFHCAFELNSSIAQTFIQRVLVLSFQRKYSQIIDEFAKKSKLETIDDPTLLMLVAKAHVRCDDNLGAIKELTKAIDIDRKNTQIYLQRGICFENLRDWTSAAAEFSKCIQLNSNFAKAYYHRGLCKLHENNTKGINDIDKALKIDPKSFEAYLTRAAFYHSRSLFEEGINDCNEALKIEPSSVRAHLLCGACKCKLLRFELALGDFTRATQLDKSCFFAYYNRAVTYQLLEDYENAVRDYSVVLLIREDSNAYRNRGLIYWKLGDHSNALLDLYAARDNFPQDARLHGLLALCLQKVNRIDESIAAFTSAIEVSPYLKEAYLGRGNVYASLKDFVRARRDYSRVLHMYPLCTSAYVNMAYTMQIEGHFKRAWHLFTLALSVDQKCSLAYEGRAMIHFVMQNYDAALIDICRAIDLEPDNSEYLTNRGVIYQYIGNLTSALENYKEAIRINPGYNLSYFNAGNLYFYQDQWELALVYYEQTLLLNPEDEGALLNHAIAKVMLKDMNGALAELNHLININPTASYLYFNRAHVYQSMEMYDEADKDYTKVIELNPIDRTTYLKRGENRGRQSRLEEAMKDYYQHLNIVA